MCLLVFKPEHIRGRSSYIQAYIFVYPVKDHSYEQADLNDLLYGRCHTPQRDRQVIQPKDTEEILQAAIYDVIACTVCQVNCSHNTVLEYMRIAVL